jgi:hypothetical protein
MTMTAADWAGLKAAGDAGGTGYLEGLAAQQQQELAGLPGAATGAAAGGTGSTSTAATIGQDAITAVENAYPDLAWMLTVPDIGPQIVQWAQQGVDETVVSAELESTPWYRTNSDSVRKWIQEVNEDPATAQADMQAQESSVNATLQSLGLNATPGQVATFAAQSLAMGWTTQQIKDQVQASIKANPDGTFSFTYGGATSGQTTSGGTLQASIQSIQAEAAKYLVPISNSTAQAFSSAMAQGTMDSTAVDAYLQKQAESLYPSIAGAIKAGITPADYVTPYKEVAAQLLGVDPNSIDMTKPQYARALSAPGPGGVPTAMSLYDWQQTLMSDPQYNYMNSVNAKDRASSIAQGLGEVFGKSPSGPAGSTAFSSAGAPRVAGVPIT